MEHPIDETTTDYRKQWSLSEVLRDARSIDASVWNECCDDYTAEMDEDLSGTTLAGKYLLVSRCGVGGMANVYAARNTVIDRPVAIKILHRRWAGHETGPSRIRREALAAARALHPNLVDIYDLGRTPDGRPYLVMELLEGQDLFTVLGYSTDGRLPVDKAVSIAEQVLAGLGALHAAGIVHRDVKPENVFLRIDPRRTVVKILDLGAALLPDAPETGSSRLTIDGSVVGTPWYMSPEQALGRPVDARSDVYAAGVLLYEMLSGRVPHDARTQGEAIVAVATRPPVSLRSLAPWVPNALHRVVETALARRPEDRFPTTDAFRQALAEAMAEPDPASPRRPRVPSWFRGTEPFLLVTKRSAYPFV